VCLRARARAHREVSERSVTIPCECRCGKALHPLRARGGQEIALAAQAARRGGTTSSHAEKSETDRNRDRETTREESCRQTVPGGRNVRAYKGAPPLNAGVRGRCSTRVVQAQGYASQRIPDAGTSLRNAQGPATKYQPPGAGRRGTGLQRKAGVSS
jgi:hypothetical protein